MFPNLSVPGNAWRICGSDDRLANSAVSSHTRRGNLESASLAARSHSPRLLITLAYREYSCWPGGTSNMLGSLSFPAERAEQILLHSAASVIGLFSLYGLD